MEDYRDAAHRHFEDAKLLHQQNPPRLPNASHLYGVAGECAIKAMMGGTKGTSKVRRVHLPDILEEFLNHNICRNASLAKRVKNCASGFSAWQVNERYFSRQAPQFSSTRIDEERNASQRLLALVAQLKRGII